MRTRILLPLLLLAFAGSAFAASEDTFHWNGKLAAGQTVIIKNLNGSVDSEAASGDQIEVTAEKSGADADRVKVEVVPSSEGVTICALYPQRSGYSECTAGPDMHNHGDNGDHENTRARVDFHVKLPRNLHFVVRDVNGSVSAKGLGLSAELSTVNGSIDVSTDEWASLHTVNGHINARFGKADWADELDIATVNGKVELELPSNPNLEVDFNSVSGHFDSDFPVTIQGRTHWMSVHGTIGSGGRRLKVHTVNGGLSLNKANV